ncbi:hypothetical protein N7463_002865 [Penicillium fimorum]|uniref:Major facilitator superfamily (MFS) profile domain-containing protein n=1 Tax=Penicillium fimorum TaxID=1882269 RepID=A0A9W9Y086_9EURO|nr:hypothetical protein N7463_002865 [Penicillium fimorum]
MAYTTLWKRLSPRQLNAAIHIFSLISIFFEGYDQGVMGGVNSSPKYVTEVSIGEPDGTVTNATHQGGIVSIYYLGAIFGCFAGGWLADRVGRINGLLAGSLFALVGGALQAGAQDSNFMLCARVITGIGTGALTGITPVLVAETSSADHRGGFLGYVFIANYLGISVAYWISFGLAFVDNGYSDPPYLASVGRNDEARDLLNRIRRDRASQDDINEEYLEIITIARGSKRSSPIEFVKAVTAYSPTLLAQAGYSDIKQNGLAGGINTIGIIGTIISAQIIDRLGRRAGSVYEGSLHHPEKASQYAPGAVTMLFLFNLGYAATWGTVAFLVPTEIFPSDLRAQGNGFGITGWAIGSRTYFLFAGLNLIWIPIVYLFYPETRNRSLESIDALFSTSSPFYWKMEQAYKLHGDVLAEHGVYRTEALSDDKTGLRTELTTTPAKLATA